jgi:hypothetical protein
MSSLGIQRRRIAQSALKGTLPRQHLGWSLMTINYDSIDQTLLRSHLSSWNTVPLPHLTPALHLPIDQIRTIQTGNHPILVPIVHHVTCVNLGIPLKSPSLCIGTLHAPREQPRMILRDQNMPTFATPRRHLVMWTSSGINRSIQSTETSHLRSTGAIYHPPLGALLIKICRKLTTSQRRMDPYTILPRNCEPPPFPSPQIHRTGRPLTGPLARIQKGKMLPFTPQSSRLSTMTNSRLLPTDIAC